MCEYNTKNEIFMVIFTHNEETVTRTIRENP